MGGGRYSGDTCVGGPPTSYLASDNTCNPLASSTQSFPRVRYHHIILESDVQDAAGGSISSCSDVSQDDNLRPKLEDEDTVISSESDDQNGTCDLVNGAITSSLFSNCSNPENFESSAKNGGGLNKIGNSPYKNVNRGYSIIEHCDESNTVQTACSAGSIHCNTEKQTHSTDNGTRRWRNLHNGVNDASLGIHSSPSVKSLVQSPHMGLSVSEKLTPLNTTENIIPYHKDAFSADCFNNDVPDKRAIKHKHNSKSIKQGKMSSSEYLKKNSNFCVSNSARVNLDPFGEDGDEFEYKKYMRLLRSNSFGSIGDISSRMYSGAPSSEKINNLSSSILANHLRSTLSSFTPSALIIRLAQQNRENSLNSCGNTSMSKITQPITLASCAPSSFERAKTVRNKSLSKNSVTNNSIFRTVTDIDIGDNDSSASTETSPMTSNNNSRKNFINCLEDMSVSSSGHCNSRSMSTAREADNCISVPRRNSIALAGSWSALDSTKAVDWLSQSNGMHPSAVGEVNRDRNTSLYSNLPINNKQSHLFVKSRDEDSNSTVSTSNNTDGLLSSPGPIPYENWRAICGPNTAVSNSNVEIPRPYERRKMSRNSYNIFALPNNIYKLAEHEVHNPATEPESYLSLLKHDVSLADSLLRNNKSRRRNSISSISDAKSPDLITRINQPVDSSTEKFIFGGRRNSKSVACRSSDVNNTIRITDTCPPTDSVLHKHNSNLPNNPIVMEKFTKNPKQFNSAPQSGELQSYLFNRKDSGIDATKYSPLIAQLGPQEKRKIENLLMFNREILNNKNSIGLLQKNFTNTKHKPHKICKSKDESTVSSGISPNISNRNADELKLEIYDNVNSQYPKNVEYHFNGSSVTSPVSREAISDSHSESKPPHNEANDTLKNSFNDNTPGIQNGNLRDNSRLKINHSFGPKNFQNSLNCSEKTDSVPWDSCKVSQNGIHSPSNEGVDKMFPSRKVCRRMTTSGLVRPALQKFVALGAQRLLRKQSPDQLFKISSIENDKLLNIAKVYKPSNANEEEFLNRDKEKQLSSYTELINDDKQSNSSDNSCMSVSDQKSNTLMYQTLDNASASNCNTPILRPPRRNKPSKKTKQIRYLIYPENGCGKTCDLPNTVQQLGEGNLNGSLVPLSHNGVNASGLAVDLSTFKKSNDTTIQKNSSSTVKKKLINKVRKRIKSGGRSGFSSNEAQKNVAQVSLFIYDFLTILVCTGVF